MRFALTRESFIPKHSTKVADKHSDAVAYLYATPNGAPAACVFVGKQAKPVTRYRYRTAAEREACIIKSFECNRAAAKAKADYKESRKVKAAEFAGQVEVGAIFHYSAGYDETHHYFFEVVELKGRFATVRKIRQAQEDLGYDYRHRCMPQSGDFCGEPVRVLLQDGRIKVDHHYHASRWDTQTVAGVRVGPSYEGGGMH